MTFAVIAYNQERFIREAVEGAFAQTYQPLEIILSDDSSSDLTFAIMQEMAAGYTGPHKVVLNQNKQNLRLVPHFNKIFELASGSFICVNAGDDFSRVDRVRFVMNEWRRQGSKHHLVHTAAFSIDDKSQKLARIKPHDDVAIQNIDSMAAANSMKNGIGATAFYSKAIYDTFGEIQEFAKIEDRPMFFRAALTGGILFIDEPLVYYRQGGVSDSVHETLKEKFLFSGRQRSLLWRISSIKCHICDLNKYQRYHDKLLKNNLERLMGDAKFELQLSTANFPKKLFLVNKILKILYHERRAFIIFVYLKYLFWPVALIFYFIRQEVRMRIHNHK